MAKPRYNYGEEQVKSFITEHIAYVYSRDGVEEPPIELAELVNLVYTTGHVPMVYAKYFDKPQMTALNRSIAILYDCGCSGKRKLLKDAVENMQPYNAMVALGEGAAQMLSNFKLKATHVVTQILSK